MKKLPIKSKIFWTNFVQFIAGVLFFSFLFSVRDSGAGEIYFNFAGGYSIVAFLCILWLGTKIATEFARDEDINELRRNENMTPGEFNEKYKNIMNIYSDGPL